MSNRTPEGFSHLPRDCIESDRRARISNRANDRRKPKTFASTAAQYFVPSFSVRRPVIKTDEVEEFINRASTNLPRAYETTSLSGVTIVEQHRMIEQFRNADIHPDPEKIENIARRVAETLRDSIRTIPRRIDIPTGRVYRFGTSQTRLGMVPAG